jgi:hypothetical protein
MTPGFERDVDVRDPRPSKAAKKMGHDTQSSRIEQKRLMVRWCKSDWLKNALFGLLRIGGS